MRGIYALTLVFGLVPACLLIQPLEDAAESGQGGGGSGNAGKGGTDVTRGKGGSAGTASCAANPPETRVKSCVYDISCDPIEPSSNISSCITYGSLYSCAKAPQSCADMAACRGRQQEAPQKCRSGETGWKCEGKVAIRCDGAPYSVDCGRLGGSCDTNAKGLSADNWPCWLDKSGSCTDLATGEYTCNGTLAYTCVNGKYYGFDCKGRGLARCHEPSPGDGHCTPYAEDCTSPGETCQANKLRLCTSDKALGVFDCALSNTACTSDSQDAMVCRASGCTQQQAESCAESCASDQVHMQVCVGGAPYVVDCRNYGFTRCVRFVKSETNEGYVVCR